MYRIPMTAAVRAAGLLAFSVFFTAESSWGQSNCKDVKADFTITVPPGTPPLVAVGTVTNGGDLDGTITMTDTVSSGSPTSDPYVVSYTQDIVITTRDGQLTATSTRIFD